MVTGWILAGGTSSRMGRDKAFLPIGSHPLIELVMQRLRPFVKRLIVIGNVHNIQRLRETLPVCAPAASLCEAKRAGAGRSADAILTDMQPGYGPLMGIYTGLMHTETLLNVFVPCDMPWVERGLLDRLAQSCDRGRVPSEAGWPMEVPRAERVAADRGRVPTQWVADGSAEDRRSSARHGVEVTASLHPVEGIQPFPLMCHATASRRIGALLNRGERSLQALFRQPGAQLITINESDLWRSFMNVNTVSDYARLTETPTAS